METVWRYEGLGQFTEGRSSLLRLERSDTFSRHEEPPPISYGGGYAPRFDGLDCVRQLGETFDGPRDGYRRPVSPEDEPSELDRLQDTMFAKQKDAWKKNGHSSAGPDPSDTRYLLPKSVERRAPGLPEAEFEDPTTLGEDDSMWDDTATRAAQAAMVAKQRDAWKKSK